MTAACQPAQVGFLLPPVPGLAVYLCAGVLLTPVCEDEFGYWGALLYASCVGYAMKMVAQVLQQKGIGEYLGESVGVKAAVGVNTDLIKAIRHILEQPGVGLAKVSILCGGPDWPTAVLCGILRCDVRQMLLGLTPIFVLTMPTSMAGAFQLRKGEGGVWAPLATLSLMVAALVQLVLGCLALYFIEKVRSDGVAKYPDDAEVKGLEAREAEAKRSFNAATALKRMPCWPKLWLLSGTFVLTSSAYLLLMMPERCFEEFTLTDDVSSMCWRLSCERTPVKPLGFVALAMLGYGVVCMRCFHRWADAAVAAHESEKERLEKLTMAAGANSTVAEARVRLALQMH